MMATTLLVVPRSMPMILPMGMIELPGCSAGSSISPRPASGPEFIQRRSLAIFISATASTLSWPDSSTAPSCAAIPSNRFLARLEPGARPASTAPPQPVCQNAGRR
jgi:hypothetical protein